MATSTAFWRPGYGLLWLALLLASCETRSSVGQALEKRPIPAEAPQRLVAVTADDSVEDPTSTEGESPPASTEATHQQTAVIRPVTEGEVRQSLRRGPQRKHHHPGPARVLRRRTKTIWRSRLCRNPIRPGPPAARGRSSPPARSASSVPTTSTSGSPPGVSASSARRSRGPRQSPLHRRLRRVGRDSLEGKELLVADSPQTVLVGKDQNALRKGPRRKSKCSGRPESKPSPRSSSSAMCWPRGSKKWEINSPSPSPGKLVAQLKMLDTQIEKRSVDQPIESVMAQIIRAGEGVNAIAVSDKEVFITCPQGKGFGYSVWRTDLDFARSQVHRQRPERLLRADGRRLRRRRFVGGRKLPPSRRPLRPRRKTLAAFGKRDRDGVGGCFSGCCNPMNLCFDKEGDLLVSESNGVVKRFTEKGKFIEQAGMAEVQPGCKNSAIKISPDGEVIYYIDVNNSQILVLTRSEQPKTTKRDSVAPTVGRAEWRGKTSPIGGEWNANRQGLDCPAGLA